MKKEEGQGDDLSLNFQVLSHALNATQVFLNQIHTQA